MSSSYYKRILRQTLPGMFPNLTIGSSKKHFVQIVENTGRTPERLEFERKEKFENRIHESIGLRKIIEMLSVCRCVLVGHNLFYDLIFIWSQFIEQLPETVQEFSELISTTFPMFLISLHFTDGRIFDTKYIAATHSSCQNLNIPLYKGLDPLQSTSLDALALWACRPNPDLRIPFRKFSDSLILMEICIASTCVTCCTNSHMKLDMTHI